jgi:hypothetical protein
MISDIAIGFTIMGETSLYNIFCIQHLVQGAQVCLNLNVNSQWKAFTLDIVDKLELMKTKMCAWFDAVFIKKIMSMIDQDGWNPKTVEALKDLQIPFTSFLVEDSLRRLKEPKSAYKFFLWAGTQPRYKHSTYAYNLIVQRLVGSEDFVRCRQEIILDMEKRGVKMSGAET